MPACAASLAYYKQNKHFFLSLLYNIVVGQPGHTLAGVNMIKVLSLMSQ